MLRQQLLVGIFFSFLWSFNQAANNALVYQLGGTWIVKNSSDVSSFTKCPFVTFSTNIIQKNANMTYYSKSINYTTILKPLNATNYEMFDHNKSVGNLTLLQSHLPDYVLIRLETHKDREQYYLLTHQNFLSMPLEREVLAYFQTRPELRTVLFQSTGHNALCGAPNVSNTGGGHPTTGHFPSTNRPPLVHNLPSHTTVKTIRQKNGTDKATFSVYLLSAIILSIFLQFK